MIDFDEIVRETLQAATGKLPEPYGDYAFAVGLITADVAFGLIDIATWPIRRVFE